MSQTKPSVWIVGSIAPQTGGMETYIRELLRSPLTDQYELQLFDISKPNVRKKQSKKYTGYDAILKRSIWLTMESFGLSLYFLCKFIFFLFTRKIDFVHIHTASYTSFWEKVMYITLCKWAGKPVIIHIHGALFDKFYNRQPNFIKSIIRYYLNLSDKVMVLSTFWYNLFSQWIPEQNISIVPNGIHTSEFMQQQFDRSQSPALLFLGELSKRKGIYDLIGILPAIKLKIPDLLVYIAGPGDINELQALCKNMQIDTDVYFMGPVFGREKLQLLQSSWVYVLPSYGEGQPMAIIEAMASGLAVVSTTVGGVPEMLTCHQYNHVCKPGNLDCLTDALISLFSHPQHCRLAGIENRQQVSRLYNIEINMQKIQSCYSDLL